MRLSKVTPGLLKIEQDCIFHLLYVCTLLSHIHTHPGNAPWCFRAPPLPQTVKDVLWNGGNKAQEDGHLHEGTLYTRKSHNWKHSNRESPCKCSKYPATKKITRLGMQWHLFYGVWKLWLLLQSINLSSTKQLPGTKWSCWEFQLRQEQSWQQQ